MTEQEMRAKSAGKVTQVMDLAESLNLRLEARQRINTETGFIENVAFWIDDEPYPREDANANVSNEAQAQSEAPVGQTGAVGESSPTELAPTGEASA